MPIRDQVVVTMRDCCESGSHCQQVCFPLSEIHSFSPDLQYSTICFGSSAFSSLCMFSGLISASVLLVVLAPRCRHRALCLCLLSFLSLCCMLFWWAVLQPQWLTSGIVVVVGLSSQNRIKRNVLRTDVSSLQSLISLFSLCSFLLLCRGPFSRDWVGCCCFSGDCHLGLNLGNYPCLCCQPGSSMLCLVSFLSHLFSCMLCPDF